MSLTSEETKYLKRIGYGAILGTSTILVPGLTQELVKMNFGFPPLNFKNVIKVAGVTEVTAKIIHLIMDKGEITSDIFL